VHEAIGGLEIGKRRSEVTENVGVQALAPDIRLLDEKMGISLDKRDNRTIVGKLDMGVRDNPGQPRFVGRAFISYAREDLDWAKAKAETLRQVDWETFLAQSNMRTGDIWPDILKEQLEKADRVFVGWSSSAVSSEWVRWEYLEAIRIRDEEGIERFLVIDCLDDTPLPPELRTTQASAVTSAGSPSAPVGTTIALLLSLALCLFSARTTLFSRFWTCFAAVWSVLGIAVWYLIYTSPEHRRRISRWLNDVGHSLSTATVEDLFGMVDRVIRRVYGEKVWSWKTLQRIAYIGLSSLILASFSGYLLVRDPFFGAGSWDEFAEIGFYTLILTPIAGFMSITFTRRLVAYAKKKVHGRSVGRGMIIGFILNLFAILAAAAWGELAFTLTWLRERIRIGHNLTAQVLGRELIQFIISDAFVDPFQNGRPEGLILIATNVVTVCFPLFLLLLVFTGAILAIPGRGLLYRIPAKFMRSISRDPQGPLSIAYPVGTILFFSTVLIFS
jgi:hypothetical protein